jgi:mercuric reductase
MPEVRIPIQGMTCPKCENKVVQVLEEAGTKNVQVSFRRGEAIFVMEKNELESAKQAIQRAGYQPGSAEIITPEETIKDEEVNQDYDLLIIGAGSAAFSAAIEAVAEGAKVAMIERGTIGGTCVNIGCVPSKTLIRAGEIHYTARQNPFAGLQITADSVNLKQLVEQKNELVNQLRHQKYIDLIDEYGFELIHGEARFVDHQTVEVDGRRITAKRFLIATGASPTIPDIPGLNEINFLTSTTALELKEVPKRLAVIGSGYIGLELGQFFHHIGSEVTLLEIRPTILEGYEPEVAEVVTETITHQGINLMTGITIDRVEENQGVKRVHITVNGEKQIVDADQILVATGRKPNTQSLNLKAAGIEVGAHGEVVVNGHLQTRNPRIYAAGDVTMSPQFVYVAAYEGALAAKNALGVSKQKVDLQAVPGVTFTNPAIATVGLTEKQARDQGIDVQTSVLPLNAVPRALVNHNTHGVIKLVADKETRKIQGVHVVAENAGEIIYAATLVVKFGLTIEDLKESLAPYLTMAEGLKLAALTFDKDVSKLSCCAG